MYGLRFTEINTYKKKGNVVIEKIEQYKIDNSELPNSISDFGLTESMGEGSYYKKIDSDVYMVYFNFGFDDLIVYYSDTKKWCDSYRKE